MPYKFNKDGTKRTHNPTNNKPFEQLFEETKQTHPNYWPGSNLLGIMMGKLAEELFQKDSIIPVNQEKNENEMPYDSIFFVQSFVSYWYPIF